MSGFYEEQSLKSLERRGMTATVLMVRTHAARNRYYCGLSQTGRIQTAWSLPAAMLFGPCPTDIEKAERVLAVRGYRSERVQVAVVERCEPVARDY